MTKLDCFKWTAIASATAVLVATIILAFVAPVYLITLWLGFTAGYLEVYSVVKYRLEKEQEEASEIEESSPKEDAPTVKEEAPIVVDEKPEEVKAETKETKAKATNKNKKPAPRKSQPAQKKSK